MTVFGIHAAHEQIHPIRLLEAVIRAEAAGFDAAMSSDHFSPWSASQGQSAFAWSWLGAALPATSLPFGLVNAPGQRYHPAVIAQAIGTLGAMYPGRFWAALGTGEASNEHITGEGWPRKEIRTARLRECVDVIRALLAGEEVNHEGLVTVNAPTDQLLGAYREAGGRGKLYPQVHLSWAPSQQEALAVAHDQWRSNIFAPPVCWDLELTDHFDAVSEWISAGQAAEVVNVSADLGQHAEWLRHYAELGFDEIYPHHVGQQLDPFIDTFGAEVLPKLRA